MKGLNEKTVSGTGEWLNTTPRAGVRTPVSQLKLGMFVAELDRPWMGTPFTTQGIKIDHPDKIDLLTECCQYVYVTEGFVSSVQPRQTLVKPIASLARKELEPLPFMASTSRRLAGIQGRGLKGQGSKGQGSKERRSVIKKLATIKSKQDCAYQIQLSVEQEYPAAQEAYAQAKLILEGAFIAAQYGSVPDMRLAEEAVRLCRESVVRNPNTLVWLSKIKHDNAYTVEHGLSVCILAMVFGRHLNFTESELDTLGLCGLLHDIGKVSIPSHIHNKQGALTADELRLMKQHTIVGYKLLRENKEPFSKLFDVTLNHHERPDGTGYPRNLKSHEISDYAKIIAIVEAYDAMTSNRCYAKAKIPADAKKTIFENIGKQFDEEYALKFIQAIDLYPLGTVVELRNGMVGIVLTGHSKFRHLPTVILSRDTEKQIINEEVVDLALTDSGELDKGYLIRRPLLDGSFGVSLKDYKFELMGGDQAAISA